MTVDPTISPSSEPSAASSPTPGHERIFAIACSFYLLGALFGDRAIRALLGWSEATNADFAFSHALAIQSLKLGLLLPVVWLLIGMLFAGNDNFRSALHARVTTIFTAIAFTLTVSLLLNALTLWPFTWRFADSGAFDYMRVLLERDQLITISVWAIGGVILVPFIEEAIFRYWLLRSLLRWSQSRITAVIGSSLLFAVLHLGNLASLDRRHLLNAAWLLVFSLLVSTITLRQNGRIVLALAAHVTRNALELVTLSVAATRN